MLETAQQVLGHLREQGRLLNRFLERLALAESPSTEPRAQYEILDILSEALLEIGYAAWRVPGRRSGGHLYARPGARQHHAPVQLLLGHCDTVWPLGTLGVMPLEVKDGVMKGPGVYDMKGGLVQMVFALRALQDLGLRPTVTPIVFVNSDEEIGSKESTRHISTSRALRRGRSFWSPRWGPRGSSRQPGRGRDATR